MAQLQKSFKVCDTRQCVLCSTLGLTSLEPSSTVKHLTQMRLWAA